MAELEIHKTWCGIIYKYTSPSEKVYIGQTTNEQKRKSKHRCETVKLNTKFGNALNKYGFDNFKYEVLFKTKDTSDFKKLKNILNLLEISYVDFYNSVELGYNISLGGQGSLGYKHTEKAKQIISEKLQGNKNSLGVYKTEEQKQEISNNLVGRFVSEETKIKIGNKNSRSVIQLDKFGNIINEFKSAVEAAKQLGLSRTGINNCCNGLSKSSGGYIWKHK